MENTKSQDANDALYKQVSEDIVGSAECYQHALFLAIYKGVRKAVEDKRPATVRFTYSAKVIVKPSGDINTDFSAVVANDDKRKLAGGGNQYDADQTSFDFNNKEDK